MLEKPSYFRKKMGFCALRMCGFSMVSKTREFSNIMETHYKGVIENKKFSKFQLHSITRQSTHTLIDSRIDLKIKMSNSLSNSSVSGAIVIVESIAFRLSKV